MNDLDRIDYSIIKRLKENARITVTELATHVGLSKSPCHARMRRLEERNYIIGYTALVNYSKLGLNHTAFIQITLDDTSSKALASFNTAILAIEEIEQCHMIAGGFDYLIKIRTKDINNYRQVLGEKISALPHVKQTSTFVAMENVKDTGV